MDDQGKAFQEVDPGEGNTPKAVLKEQVMRIYGIWLENEGADMLDIFLQMENIRADIFAFAETKLASDQPYVHNLLQRNKRKIWDHARLVTSTSKVVLEGYHKPGGTRLARLIASLDVSAELSLIRMGAGAAWNSWDAATKDLLF
jgi:hypothetical protein